MSKSHPCAHAAFPMDLVPMRVRKASRETRGTVTLELDPGASGFPFLPGQFNMLYVFGNGEVPISISGDPDRPESLVHTIRGVGTVSRALCRLGPGDVLGVRGPFGSQIVYEHPEYLSALDASSPVSAHVKTDLELRGCPPDQRQILEVLTACLHGKKPELPRGSVCLECKRKGLVCVMVSRGIPCLGPVTHAGCGALCPAYDRGCYGCFGPKETPNTASLSAWISGKLGMRREDVLHSWRHINGFAEAFCLESMKHESTDTSGGPEPD